MKKILTTVILAIGMISLVGCTDTSKGATNFSSEYCNMEVVTKTNDGRILEDVNTGVLYLWYKDNDMYGQSLTPLYNADGSLKNINDFAE